MIELCEFEASDCERLISWIPDAGFLRQWAGTKYVWPLDARQIEETIGLTTNDKPSHYMFKAVVSATSEVIGHIELMRVNHEKKTAVVGRVLIGDPALRGKGLGRQLITQLITHAFGKLELDELTLSVYDFNTPARDCYRRIGFEPFESRTQSVGDENWNVTRMRLRQERFSTIECPLTADPKEEGQVKIQLSQIRQNRRAEAGFHQWLLNH